jgi:sulfite dehydrogenase
VRGSTLFAVALMAAAPFGAAAQDLELGKAVFVERAQPSCGICHTLADAGTGGEIGPVLDQLKPDASRVKAAVTGGVGAMPAYADLLSAEEIDAVAQYVASATN